VLSKRIVITNFERLSTRTRISPPVRPVFLRGD